MKEKRKLSNSTGNLLMETKGPSMTNPLQQAVFRGCVECIQVLVETPPYFSVDSACGPEGLRPIHIASREGHINILRYLTSAGACVLKSDFHGLTALHHASIGGEIRAVRWLLRHGAEITLDKRGRSPIQAAADNDHLDIVSLLAKHASCGSNNNLLIKSASSCASTHCTISGNPSRHHQNRRSSSSSPSSKLYQHRSSSASKTYGHSSSRNFTNNNNSNHLHQQFTYNNKSDLISDKAIKTHHNNSNNNKSSHTFHGSRNKHLSICGSTSAASAGINNSKVLDDKSVHQHNELSSSGNSSLATISGCTTPSLSPSSAVTTNSCSCPSSSESSTSSREDRKSGVITFSDCSESQDNDDYLNSGCCNGKSNNNTNKGSFYLHPPKSALASSSKPHFQNHHKRQPSTASSFYLHPPTAATSDLSIGTTITTATSSSSIGIGSSSSVGTTHCTSVVHFADEDSDIEIQEASADYCETSRRNNNCENNNSVLRMAPVTPNNCSATEFIPPKNEHNVIITNDKADSTSSSPSPPPPAPKSARTQSPNSSKPVKKNGILTNGNNSEPLSQPPPKVPLPARNTRKGLAPPPPPPPPMPKFDQPIPISTFSSKSSTLKDVSNHPVTNGFRSENPENKEEGNNNDVYSVNGEENDYEDIDEIHNQAEEMSNNRQTIESNNNNNKRLSRSVSAPANQSPNNTLSSNNGFVNGKVVGGGGMNHVNENNNMTDNNNGNNTEKSNNNNESQDHQLKVPTHISIAAKLFGIDGKRVPFIPPNFPDPPKDALIKPSEYLKSIQQQNKSRGNNNYGITNGNTNNYGINSPSELSSNCSSNSNSTSPSDSPISKVEETIKILNGNNSKSTNYEVTYNGNTDKLMQTVPEETNAVAEQEEINLERIDNGVNNNANKFRNGFNEKSKDLNQNGSNNNNNSSNGQQHHAIQCNELSKVNLRKTPTSRTTSAPILGRVLPEKPNEKTYLEPLNKNIKNGGGDVSTLSTAIIAELSESSQLGGVREWKEELRRRQIEMEKASVKEMDQVYSALNFVAEVPSTDPVSGVPIPPWKRQMIAKKVAEKARKEAEEQRKLEAEAKRVASIPAWRRQLLQKRESTTDGKY